MGLTCSDTDWNSETHIDQSGLASTTNVMKKTTNIQSETNVYALL